MLHPMYLKDIFDLLCANDAGDLSAEAPCGGTFSMW